jgi:glycosyltransferase involved in cell wall biosynthesis
MNENEQIPSDKFSILIPVYNEENNVVKLADEIEKLGLPFLFVDDGSTDKTLTNMWLKDLPTICYFPNRGKGYAIRLGTNYLISAEFPYILTLDGDGQCALSDIEKFDNELLFNEDVDIFIGNRMWDEKKMPLIRRWVNKLFSLVITKLSGVSIPDSQCGFRLYSKKVFETLDLKCTGFDFESEVLIKAGRAGMKIKSIPIQCIYNKKRHSKIRVLRDGCRFLKLILSLKINK